MRLLLPSLKSWLPEGVAVVELEEEANASGLPEQTAKCPSSNRSTVTKSRNVTFEMPLQLCRRTEVPCTTGVISKQMHCYRRTVAYLPTSQSAEMPIHAILAAHAGRRLNYLHTHSHTPLGASNGQGELHRLYRLFISVHTLRYELQYS